MVNQVMVLYAWLLVFFFIGVQTQANESNSACLLIV